ncbi:hypothetical protein [Kitasatospora sp. NPDC085879]|uniref:hypothetical protein n=1 Tax=Kitasatospora sp. NPDC085879 TaxID=3154769 RepID=UPI0034220895
MTGTGRETAVGRSRDHIRSRLWPLPTLGVALAVIAGVTLPRLDAHLEQDLPAWLSDNLFAGGAGAARTVLEPSPDP